MAGKEFVMWSWNLHRILVAGLLVAMMLQIASAGELAISSDWPEISGSYIPLEVASLQIIVDVPAVRDGIGRWIKPPPQESSLHYCQ